MIPVFKDVLWPIFANTIGDIKNEIMLPKQKLKHIRQNPSRPTVLVKYSERLIMVFQYIRQIKPPEMKYNFQRAFLWLESTFIYNWII